MLLMKLCLILTWIFMLVMAVGFVNYYKLHWNNETVETKAVAVVVFVCYIATLHVVGYVTGLL